MTLIKGDKVRVLIDILINPSKKIILHIGDIGIVKETSDFELYIVEFDLGTYCLKGFEIEKVPSILFHDWYREVKRLVEQAECIDENYDLPTGILREWWKANKSPQDAAHMIAHDGI